MIKYLLVIFFLTFAAALIYMRLRPYINIARRALGFVRDARRMAAPDAPPRAQAAGGGKLVRCASCGTWLPASRALTFRASPHPYCSQECLERTGRDEDRAPRAARKL